MYALEYIILTKELSNGFVSGMVVKQAHAAR
jgi:hypothetical protein